MINITVDEGVAFDMLSIAATKAAMNPNNQKLDDNLMIFVAELTMEVGRDAFEKVISSKEYAELTATNVEIYKKIDSLKENEQVGDAQIIDELNHTRFRLKKKIQSEFFGNSLTEQKFGYKQND